VHSGAPIRVDPDRVVHETIDGETILINLDQGTYHSLSGAGPEVWSLVVDGEPFPSLVNTLSGRHDADEAYVAHEVAGLLRELDRQGLVECEAAASDPVAVGPAPSAQRGSFVAPVLDSYDDMQYLLLLDPIHDFESDQWTARADAGPGASA
jgi:hypothetical protein